MEPRKNSTSDTATPYRSVVMRKMGGVQNFEEDTAQAFKASCVGARVSAWMQRCGAGV